MQKKSLRKRPLKRNYLFFYHFWPLRRKVSVFCCFVLGGVVKTSFYLTIWPFCQRKVSRGFFVIIFRTVSDEFSALHWIQFDEFVKTASYVSRGNFWGTLFPENMYFFSQFWNSIGKFPVFFWENCRGLSYLVLDVRGKFLGTEYFLGKIYVSSPFWTLSVKCSFPLL